MLLLIAIFQIRREHLSLNTISLRLSLPTFKTYSHQLVSHSHHKHNHNNKNTNVVERMVMSTCFPGYV